MLIESRMGLDRYCLGTGRVFDEFSLFSSVSRFTIPGMERKNDFGQEIGDSLSEWKGAPFPPGEIMEGRFCILEPLAESHVEDLWEANQVDREGKNWTYLPYGPFEDFQDYREWVHGVVAEHDPQFYAVIVGGRAMGVASYLRISPGIGSIEVGHIHFSNSLQRTAAATEAMFLMMKKAFELGYRRYEWKCDALNAPSRAAAKRLGFQEEGVFRRATIYKGRNRDTAWYSIIDSEWPELKERFEAWLSPDNFDEEGRQKSPL